MTNKNNTMETFLLEDVSLSLEPGEESILGVMTHRHAVEKALEGYAIPNQVSAYSKTKGCMTFIEAPTFQERAELARQIGRDIAHEFGEDPVQYITISSLAFIAPSDESDLLPNDHPHRQEFVVTQSVPIYPLFSAQTMEDHLLALKNWNIRVWGTVLHEGVVAKEEWEDALAVTSINKENSAYPKEETNIAVLDSPLLSEIIIGMSSSFPGIQAVSMKDPTLALVDLELAKRKLEDQTKVNR